MISKTSAVYTETSTCTRELLEGVVVGIDPSIGSTSSQPGFSVYRAQQLMASGTLDIPAHRTIPERLRMLNNHVRKLFRDWSPDVLVYEQIPAQRHGGGGNAWGHASLLKALGVILSIPGPDHHVGILPVSWRKLTRPDYVKGDENDAIEFTWIVLQLAQEIEEAKERKPKKSSKATSKSSL